MQILLLPGNSPRHEQWASELAAFLCSRNHTVQTQIYRHWQTGEQQADVEYELQQASDAARDFSEYAIVAKSIGTMIALLGTTRDALRPSQLVLLGVPLELLDSEMRQAVSNLQTPITIMQNESDPFGAAKDVATLFPGATLITTPGDTHDYLDFTRIEQTIAA